MTPVGSDSPEGARRSYRGESNLVLDALHWAPTRFSWPQLGQSVGRAAPSKKAKTLPPTRHCQSRFPGYELQVAIRWFGTHLRCVY